LHVGIVTLTFKVKHKSWFAYSKNERGKVIQTSYSDLEAQGKKKLLERYKKHTLSQLAFNQKESEDEDLPYLKNRSGKAVLHITEYCRVSCVHPTVLRHGTCKFCSDNTRMT
jgi:hypothetical protein